MTTRPRPPPTTISPTCIIADAAVLTGKHPIIISSNAILHPRARIVSTHGPVTIGEGCIVSEKASVGLLNPPSPLVTTCADASANVAEQAKDGDETPGVVLEKDVVLEPAAVVEAERVCEGTVLEAGSKVGAGAILGKYCKVAPLCTIPAGDRLDDFTIVFGNNQQRREKSGLEGLRRSTHAKEIEVLRLLIPTNLAKWQTV